MLSVDDFALSTMWNYPYAKTGAELVKSIKAAGFCKVELNYQVRGELLPQTEALLSAGALDVVSLHNVFPKVMDSRFDTDSMLLGYQDEGLRREAVRLTKQTVDWAARLGAKAVVVHPTEVPLDPEQFDKPLKQLIREKRQSSEDYRDLFARLLRHRQAAPYLAALTKSLQELGDYIVRNDFDVFLGLENRSMCHQIPIFSEFELIFDTFYDSPVKLWLDTGHGIMMEEIGLQKMPLPQKLKEQIIGMHIHDALQGRDHYPPGLMRSGSLAPYYGLIKDTRLKVLEISSRYSAEDVYAGALWLVDQLNGHEQES